MSRPRVHRLLHLSHYYCFTGMQLESLQVPLFLIRKKSTDSNPAPNRSSQPNLDLRARRKLREWIASLRYFETNICRRVPVTSRVVISTMYITGTPNLPATFAALSMSTSRRMDFVRIWQRAHIPPHQIIWILNRRSGSYQFYKISMKSSDLHNSLINIAPQIRTSEQ